MLRLLESEPRKLEILPFSVDGQTGLREGHLVVKGDERLGYITSVRSLLPLGPEPRSRRISPVGR